MATIYTHGVFGLGLGKLFTGRRMPWLFWVLAFVLPMVPDADVMGTLANIPYGAPLGHRGLSHSLSVALLLALPAAALLYHDCKVKFWVLWLFFFAAIASHGVLDAFTNGGYGVAFFWPASARRFGPWGPIQVSDIGFEIPDPRQSRSLQTEFLWVWIPMGVLVALAMCVRRIRRRNAPNGGAPANRTS